MQRENVSQTCGHRIAWIWTRLIVLSGVQMVYHRQSFASVDELKQAIVEAWQKLPQSFRDKSVDERRLDCVVWQNGGHVEHMLINM